MTQQTNHSWPSQLQDLSGGKLWINTSHSLDSAWVWHPGLPECLDCVYHVLRTPTLVVCVMCIRDHQCVPAALLYRRKLQIHMT